MKKRMVLLNLSPIFKSVLGFSLSSLLIAVINFVSIPIITRVFSPDSVGKVNVFSSYVLFSTEVVMLGIGHSFLRFYHENGDKKSQRNFFTFCVFLLLGLAGATIIFILVCWRWLSFWIFGEANFILAVCFAFSIIFNIFISISVSLDRAEDRPFFFSIQSVCLVMVNKLLYVTVGVYNAHYKLAIGFIVLGQFLTLLFCIGLHKKDFFNTVSFNQIVPFAKRTFQYAIPIWISMFIAQINNILPITIVKQTFSYELVGIFTTTVSVASILTLIQSGFSTYWNTFVFTNYEKNSKIVQNIAENMVVILSGFALSMILVQDVLFFLVGKNFIDGKTIFSVLILANLCNAINDIGSYGIYLSGKTMYNVYCAIGSVLLVILFSTMFIPQWGVCGMAISMASACIVNMVVKNTLGAKFYPIYKNYYIVFQNVFIVLTCAVLNMVFYRQSLYRYSLSIIVFAIFLIVNRRCIMYLLNYVITLVKIKEDSGTE